MSPSSTARARWHCAPGRSCTTALRSTSRPRCCASCTAPKPTRSSRCRTTSRCCPPGRQNPFRPWRLCMWLKQFIASLTLAVVVVPAQADMPKEVNFGIISTDSSAALRGRWQPVLDDMAARTGVKVNAFFATDYAGVIEAMRFKKVDLAWFGNKSAIEAVDRAGGEVFVQTLDEDGVGGYYSLLITHRDSPFKTFDDVLKRGKEINFGIGDPNSTSGFAVPSYYVFSLNHIDPKTHFKTIRSANHETNLQAILNRQLDVATNNTEQFAILEKRMPERAKEIRILWKSPLIASDPMVWRRDLDPEAKAKIKAFFLAYGTKEEERQRL